MERFIVVLSDSHPMENPRDTEFAIVDMEEELRPIVCWGCQEVMEKSAADANEAWRRTKNGVYAYEILFSGRHQLRVVE